MLKKTAGKKYGQLPGMQSVNADIDRELLIDPLPQGEFYTLRFSKTTLYKKQNDTCWSSGGGGVTV